MDTHTHAQHVVARARDTNMFARAADTQLYRIEDKRMRYWDLAVDPRRNSTMTQVWLMLARTPAPLVRTVRSI